MAFTHKITTTYTDETGQAAGTQFSNYTGTQIDGVDTSIPASSTDLLVAANWLHTPVQSTMYAAPDGPLTVKVNSSTSPAATLNLAAGQMIFWGHDFTGTNPVNFDVTALYVTNAGTSASRFKVRVLST